MFLFIIVLSSCGSNYLIACLGKVRRHVLLKVEICELITLLELEKTSKLLVGNNLATIVLVLKLVLTDVRIDLTSDLCASHLGTNWLT